MLHKDESFVSIRALDADSVASYLCVFMQLTIFVCSAVEGPIKNEVGL